MVIIEWIFPLFSFIHEKPCLYAYMLPNSFPKFDSNLQNSFDEDTGKEA